MNASERLAAIGPAFVKAMCDAHRTVVARNRTELPQGEAILLSRGTAVYPRAMIEQYGDALRALAPDSDLVAAEDLLAQSDDG